MTPHSHHRSSRMVAGGGRSGGDCLDQRVLLLRHRADAGVDAHSERSAGRPLDPTTARIAIRDVPTNANHSSNSHHGGNRWSCW